MADARSGVDVVDLIAEHHQAVYRYAYRLTGSVQDAEDLTQQVFLAAQRKIGQLRKIDAAGSWLFAILRNCFLRDKQGRWPALAGDLELNLDLVASPPDSEEIDKDRLQQVLDDLPDGFRLVLAMYYFEGCSYREIAEQLELPIGTVMSRLARAKSRLRSLWLEPEKQTGRPAAEHAGRTRIVR